MGQSSDYSLCRNPELQILYRHFANAHHFTLQNPQFHATIINEQKTKSVNIRQKLQEKLHPIEGAWLDTSKVCLDGTRTTIIKEISDWIQADNAPQIFFLCGEAGTGKSTISHTIGRAFRQYLGAFFCFNRAFSVERTPSKALRTIAYELGIYVPNIGKGLLNSFRDDPHISSSVNVEDQWKNLIVGPAKMTANPFRPVVIILDALDESGPQLEDGPRDRLLNVLFNGAQDLPKNFRVLVTARLENDVISYIKSLSVSSTPRVQYMKDINGTPEDIYRYVCNRMMKRGALGMLDENQCRILAEKAGGYFQWASTVCEALRGKGKAGLTVSKRFKRFLDSGPTHNDLQPLDGLYKYILEEYFDYNDEDVIIEYRSVLAQVLAAFEPLSITSLRKLRIASGVEGDENGVEAVVSFLGSLLTGIDSVDTPVKPVHTSIYDFLLDKNRSTSHAIDIIEGHWILAQGTLRLMMKELHFNMCHLESSHLLNSQIENLQTKVVENLSPDLLYACCVWDLHLQQINPTDSWLPLLNHFFEQVSLYWMEVLGTVKKIGLVARGARNVVAWVKGFKTQRLQNLGKDLQQFTQIFGKMITESTPHLYLSGISFLPKGSILTEIYKEKCNRIAVVCGGYQTDWPSQETVMWHGKKSSVISIALSPDGKKIVSGSIDNSMQIWDAETGAAIGSPLQGHTNQVTSVAFSPDGRKIVSGSKDSSLRIWNGESGAAIGNPLRGHSRDVTSVSFSPDGQKIASGSWDHSVWIWNAETGAAFGSPLKGHTHYVTSVAFSLDGKKIVSGSFDKSVRIWDAESRATIQGPLEGHTEPVTSVAFAPDGRKIVSGSRDSQVRIWDVEAGVALGYPLQGHTKEVNSVSFSPDGTKIVGALIGSPMKGHANGVSCIAVSPDGKRIVSGSYDNTLCIWNAETGIAVGNPLRGHTDVVTSVAFSPDGRRIVSGSFDCTSAFCTHLSHLFIHSHSSFCDLHLNSDGWLCGSDSSLLLWIPPEYRFSIVFPPTRVVIDRNGQTTLDLSNFAHGTHWTECHADNHSLE
ncbi:hypothetical protein GYMLUDRAFT_1023890 [Collybiopsis luxurians FD-317 M1]|nr:hypothetical protein GYMLUDRAFT_1023890 [Collybiopsis luxurians FD-317 M1]